MNVDWKQFLITFNRNYEDLWKHATKDDWHKLAERFDIYMHAGNNVEFIREFIDYRKKYITSDLECAAFMKTLNKFKKVRLNDG